MPKNKKENLRIKKKWNTHTQFSGIDFFNLLLGEESINPNNTRQSNHNQPNWILKWWKFVESASKFWSWVYVIHESFHFAHCKVCRNVRSYFVWMYLNIFIHFSFFCSVFLFLTSKSPVPIISGFSKFLRSCEMIMPKIWANSNSISICNVCKWNIIKQRLNWFWSLKKKKKKEI